MPNAKWDEVRKGVEWLLRQVPTSHEGWISVSSDGLYEAALFDLAGQDLVWHNAFESLHGAKVAVGRALRQHLPFLFAPGVPPEPDADAEASDTGSIWEWDDELRSWTACLAGNGLVIELVVTEVAEDYVEADILLGQHVFREGYESLWHAKHGAASLGAILIDRFCG